MTITHTPARPTDTMALTGSPAESSSVPARGSVAAIMVAVASTAAEASTVAEASLAVDRPSADAAASLVAAQLAADQWAVASEEAPHLGALPGVASKAEEVRAAGEASMVEEVPAVAAALVVAGTGKFGFA
jgi:hypothetical protein